MIQAEAKAAPYSALVVDVDSERVLYSQSPDELRHPASLTKMMTLYMVFEALSRGELTLDSMVMASSHATSRPPSSLGLRTGESLTVEQAILAVVTQSANDAATTLAEHLGRGSEAEFAEMMTQKARQLGMTGSSFYNASGLPHPNQWTTAWDMYRLGRALQKNFPQYYPYFSTQSFEFRGRSYHNHNHLLETYQGTDGIKTGFVNASGFNLVASARRNGHRLIGVVFGGNSYKRRDAHMREILDDGFDQLDGRDALTHNPGFGEREDRALLRRPESIARMLSAGGINEYHAEALHKPKSSASTRLNAHVNKMFPQKQLYTVQVGALFSVESDAERALKSAMKASSALAHGRSFVSVHNSGKNRRYTARISGLERDDANTACKALRSRKLACAVVTAG
ncbi:D-alanyl-D-alanine carboxypeptidase [Candidatus Methylospira mobilis]|uniref:D-alanyl-D-alanine carboxypeptidase n=1 Tax=Candidatus Methylospira mobilis TaxID=1808979 RepID=UPI0028F04744|nr:D-alanyl-D-alanine carboxypeptidase [Candidatus Methylospira mobilis]WNV04899.1 D-alanyl-D-alanine carboxypeptidase [Candidatus Methylospira mobilis]